MKNLGKITVMLLILVITCNGNLNAQRGMRGMADTTRAERFKRSMEFRNMNQSQSMHRGMRQGPVVDMRRGRNNSSAWQAGPNRQVPIERMGKVPSGRGRYGMEMIPELTDDQKKSLFALKLEHDKEMAKLREEMSAKVQTIRDSQRKSVLEQLNDDQKKAFELAHPLVKKAEDKNK